MQLIVRHGAGADVIDEAQLKVRERWRVENPPQVAAAPTDLHRPAPRNTARFLGRRGRVRSTGAAVSQRITAVCARETASGTSFILAPVWLGSGAVVWFAMEHPPAVVAFWIVAICFAIFALLLRRASSILHGSIAAAAVFVFGMLVADIETRRAATTVLDQPVTAMVIGIVERREAGARGEWRYGIRLTGTIEPVIRRPPERVNLLARARHEPLQLGDVVTGKARLSPPSGPALPGLNDFAFGSYYDGIGAVGYFLGAPKRGEPDPAQADIGWVASADRWLFSLRDSISLRIRSVIPGDSGAFAASIITGEQRAMSPELTEALRLSGLAHITAISGLNMALAAGIFFVGLRLLLALFPALVQAFPVKKLAAAGALFGAFCYLLISGYQVSAVRAFLMTAIMLVAVLVDRPAISLRNLALAALIIIAISPSEVMGPSFQMSFAATAALISGYAFWRDHPMPQLLPPGLPGAHIGRPVWTFVAGTLMTSLIGGLSTAIFAVSHFHRLAPHSLEANLMAMPIISLVVMPAALPAMLLMPFGLDVPFLMLMGWGLSLVGDIAAMVAGWGEGIGFSRLPVWFLPTAVVGLVLVTLLQTWLRHAGTLLLAASLVGAAVGPSQPPPAIIVAESGDLVGLVTDGRIATNRKRPPSFIFRQWQQALQRAGHDPPGEVSGPAPPPRVAGQPTPRLTSAELAAARNLMRRTVRLITPDRFSCLQKSWCVARLAGGWIVVTIENAALIGIGCDVADIVVTSRRTRMTACRSGAELITVDSLRRSGALEISLGDRIDHRITMHPSFASLERPWMRHRLYDWRTDSFASQARDAGISGSGE